MTPQVCESPVDSPEAGRWAAEEAALQLGWLGECPFHGELFKAPGACLPRIDYKSAEPGAEAGRNATLRLLATQLQDAYAERCPLCVHEESIPD